MQLDAVQFQKATFPKRNVQDNNNPSVFSRLASSALVTMINVKNDLMQFVKQYVESFIQGMDFVKREEFEVVKKIATDNQLALQNLLKKEKEKEGNKAVPARKGRERSSVNQGFE